MRRFNAVRSQSLWANRPSDLTSTLGDAAILLDFANPFASATRHEGAAWERFGYGRAMRTGSFSTALALSLLAGCGARGELLSDETTTGGTGSTTTTSTTTGAPLLPIALYVAVPSSCPEARPVETAPAELAPPEQGDDVAVVELYYRDECTGLGGQHIIAHDVEGFGDHWLGAHGCYFFPVPSPPEPQYGVVLYNITAAYFEIPPSLCIGFPGEPPGVTSTYITRAIGVFQKLEDAKAFAASLPGPP